MTKEEMELLADIVVGRLLEKQKEYDDQFKKEMEALQQEFKEYGDIVLQTDEELINGVKNDLKDTKELTSKYLDELLSEALREEEYEKAAMLKDILRNMKK
jgi:excinuclease UvrABC helicase subunit UvrB